MAEICRHIVEHPSAWRGPEIGGKDGITHRLTDRQLAAIDALLERTKALAPQDVTRRDFDHPDLSPLLQDLYEVIQHGRGCVIVAGITKAKYSEEQFERIYWGFGTHWGTAGVQSGKNDRLGHVRFVPIGPDNPTARGYRGNQELTPHTDNYEIVGLMSVEKSVTGGHSQLVSAVTIHNEIVKNRPELLEPLYRGYPYATRESRFSASPITSYNVPVFCYVDGQVSVRYTDTFIKEAAEHQGVALPADLAEGMRYLHEVATRDDIRLNFMLEPGEMMFLNNFVTLHAREPLQDSVTQKRHLLRLWLDVAAGQSRKVIPEFVRQRDHDTQNLHKVA
jgi:hypothetical protein